jgi:hypothetical protein
VGLTEHTVGCSRCGSAIRCLTASANMTDMWCTSQPALGLHVCTCAKVDGSHNCWSRKC